MYAFEVRRPRHRVRRKVVRMRETPGNAAFDFERLEHGDEGRSAGTEVRSNTQGWRLEFVDVGWDAIGQRTPTGQR
jgi:hypothetical protein